MWNTQSLTTNVCGLYELNGSKIPMSPSLLFSRVQLLATPWTADTRLPCPSASPGAYSNSCPLSQWCHQPSCPLSPLLLLPSIFPSIGVFSSELTLCIRQPKYWSFSFSTSPSNEYSGPISFRMDWWDLLAVQGTLKSVLNTTVQKHQFFGAKLSLQYNSHIHT